ncbi:hypothetical protein CLOSTASPAR_02629, partial [[Clostridium] asparagiforme DSM 15981]
ALIAAGHEASARLGHSCPEKIVSIMLNHISCIVSLRAIEIRLFVHIQYY